MFKPLSLALAGLLAATCAVPVKAQTTVDLVTGPVDFTTWSLLGDASARNLTPGNGFGPGGEGWQRLALVHPIEQLEQGAERIGQWLRQL